MKKIIAVAFLLSASTIALADKWTYNSAINSVVANEKELSMCAPAPDDAGTCYEDTISKYNSMIRDIRAQNGQKVDSLLWQSINLNYKKGIDSCRSDENLSDNRLFFYPYQDCLTNHLHNLLITTIELHLK